MSPSANGFKGSYPRAGRALQLVSTSHDAVAGMAAASRPG
jgi:hypothetical protein